MWKYFQDTSSKEQDRGECVVCVAHTQKGCIQKKRIHVYMLVCACWYVQSEILEGTIRN